MNCLKAPFYLTFPIFLTLTTMPLVQAQPVEVVVRKAGVEENPTLLLQSFDGPAEIERLLQQTLIRCGWFRVVPQGPADYVVRAAWSGDAERGRLRLAVTTGDQPILDFNTPAGNQARTTVYQGVDTLLQRLFEVPGIASARIAFVSGRGAAKEIYTMNFDGSEVRQITRNNSISTEPSWAGRQNSTIFYTFYESMRMSIIMVDLERGRQRRIARFNGLNAGAKTSPDNRSLAMSLSRDGNVNLYIMNLENEQLRQLTRDRSVTSSPAWSPNGQTICYVSDRAGRPHLYLISAAGGESQRLLRELDEAVEPDWCQLSNQIAFSTSIDGRYAIAVVEMAAEGPRQRRIITPPGGDWESPSWAPDGRHLAAVRNVGGQKQLVMIDSWLGQVVEMTRPGRFELPDWSGLSQNR